MSQGIGLGRGRETRKGQSVKHPEDIRHLSLKFTVLNGHGLGNLKTFKTVVSKITDQRSA